MNKAPAKPNRSSPRRAPAKGRPGTGRVEAEWKRLLAKYSPDIAKHMRAARNKLRSRIPRGYELIYDNYNALATGFSPTGNASAAVISLAAYPRWVTLFFLQGAGLDDPHRLLEGTGSRVRSIRLRLPDTLDDPRVARLIQQALGQQAAAFAAAPALSTHIKSVSARQRPRRPRTPKSTPQAASKSARPKGPRRTHPAGSRTAPRLVRATARPWQQALLLIGATDRDQRLNPLPRPAWAPGLKVRRARHGLPAVLCAIAHIPTSPSSPWNRPRAIRLSATHDASVGRMRRKANSAIMVL
jgi:hypothetical protein